MPKILTKEDIEFDSVTLNKVTDIDGNVTVLASVGYTVTTVEGEEIKRSLVGHELSGTDRTRINSAFSSLKAAIRTKEGL